jgi:hypothetical protein
MKKCSIVTHEAYWVDLGRSTKASRRIPHGIPLWLPHVYEVQGVCPRGPGNLWTPRVHGPLDPRAHGVKR